MGRYLLTWTRPLDLVGGNLTGAPATPPGYGRIHGRDEICPEPS